MTPPQKPPREHDLGLEYDLGTLQRRRFLGLFAGAGLAVVAGCATDNDTDSTTSGTTTTTSSTPSATSSSSTTAGTVDVDEIPQETAGPYPGDGSNGPNVLTESGIVRKDITKSFGSASGVATGVPLTVELTILDAAKDTPLAGAAVYLWHCDAQGRYSLYSDGATNENYLRGVQAADSNGTVTFTSIFPAAYRGRWPERSAPPRSWPSRRTSATPSTPPTGTTAARRTCSRPRSRTTTCSATTMASTSSPPSPATSAAGTSRSSTSACDPGRRGGKAEVRRVGSTELPPGK